MTTEIDAAFAALAVTLARSTVAVRVAGRGGGSGIVWSADGAIVTNAHVATSRDLEIVLPDGEAVRGTLERRDERTDLALVRIAPRELRPAEIGEPATVRAGHLLAAFGHPLGVPNVLSTGIAFADHTRESRYVRADLRLQPGNSGGPLADAHGRIVGVNSMVASGLALAVPSDVVEGFLGRLAPPRRLGVRLAPARLADGRAAYVVTGIVPGSAAERARIMVGDTIVARSLAALGDAPRVTVQRGGATLTLEIARAAETSAAA